MLNSKNNYIVSIALANKAKSNIYQQDIPELEDQFQDIQANLVTRLVESLAQTQTFTHTHLKSLTIKAEQATSAIAKVDITRDQNLFIAFNLRHFTPPPDWKFEACASYYDTGTINTEPGPKVILQNRFTRAQAKLEEAKGLMQTKDQEANGVRVQVAKEIADEKTDVSVLTPVTLSACSLTPYRNIWSYDIKSHNTIRLWYSYRRNSRSYQQRSGVMWGLSSHIISRALHSLYRPRANTVILRSGDWLNKAKPASRVAYLYMHDAK
ncbi:hypothetical protein FRC18_007540 [Serendipita sp. 400]|nr:hypothetical protein FRC18_007540 [Serendipita sp. 400]